MPEYRCFGPNVGCSRTHLLGEVYRMHFTLYMISIDPTPWLACNTHWGIYLSLWPRWLPPVMSSKWYTYTMLSIKIKHIFGGNWGVPSMGTHFPPRCSHSVRESPHMSLHSMMHNSSFVTSTRHLGVGQTESVLIRSGTDHTITTPLRAEGGESDMRQSRPTVCEGSGRQEIILCRPIASLRARAMAGLRERSIHRSWVLCHLLYWI